MAINDKNRVDDMGIRKAPVPLYGNSVKQLPAVRQDFVLHPSLEIDSQDPESLVEPSTAKDYQPKIKDVSKRWKRTKRTKNFFSGLIMLLATAVTLLPFIFAYFQIKVDNEVVIVENEIGVGFTNEPIPEPEPEYPDSPQTGDNSNLGLWFGLAIGSLSLLILMLILGKKKRKVN